MFHLEPSFERFRKFGTAYVNKRLVHETVSTIDPENVKEILGSRFEDSGLPVIRVRTQATLVGDGTLTLHGPDGSTPMQAS